MMTSGKPFPHFETDEDVEHFVDTADLSEYDFSAFKPSRFVLREEEVSLRLTAAQLNAIKQAAANEGIPYQRFIGNAIDRALSEAGRCKTGS
jgi:predicted DNA binding CopG/RHH family protein